MDNNQLVSSAGLDRPEVEPHAGGRPTLKTEEMIKKLVKCFEEGVSDRTACQVAGITKQTLYNWENSDQRFFDRIVEAKNFQKFLATQRVNGILKTGEDRDAGPMARWVLEKKEPEVYGTQSNLVINQNFTYQPPSWFVSDFATVEMQMFDQLQVDEAMSVQQTNEETVADGTIVTESLNLSIF